MLKTSSGGRSGQSALAGLETKLAGRDPDDSVVPRQVRKAVRFMLGGAAVTAVAGLFSLLTVISDPELINNGNKPTSGALTRDIVEIIILTLVYCALWVLMARMNRSGQIWARIVASVLFAIATFDLYSAVSSLHGGQTILLVNIISFVLEVAEWVCGCGAIALLWRSESSVYFKAHSGRR
jgi:hypothetical protein